MTIKTVGKSGQISLGKEHAGKTVAVEEIDDDVWIVKAGRFVPDNERWLHTSEVREQLDRAFEWAEKHPPRETDLDELEKRLENGEGAP